MNTRIRLRETDSAFSVNSDANMDIELKQHTKLLPFDSVVDTVDKMDVFLRERSECNKYRIILTIRPYCTNILFNAITEIFKNNIEINDTNSTANFGTNADIIGKRNDLTRAEMVRNTEYSSVSDVTYHFGLDIFNNHLLRNKSLKFVNKPKDSNQDNDVYNTIRDFMRDSEGNHVKYISRKSINDNNMKEGRHLYTADDIMTIEEAINNNLENDNGWFGVRNKSFLSNVNTNFLLPDIEVCDFIDMYPDRTLYSFKPKYDGSNEKRNWDVILTYPYAKTDENDLIRGSYIKDEEKIWTVNALKVEIIEGTINIYDSPVILLKTYVKHGMSKGDSFQLYYRFKSDETQTEDYEKYDGRINVNGLGNWTNKGEEYYFYTYDSSEIVETLIEYYEEKKGEWSHEDKTEILDEFEFRISRISNGIECEYYFTKLKKLSNYNFENYALAFSSTVYNDECCQVTYTDTVDIEGLTDYMNKPLTDIYFTILKTKSDNAFGKLSAGVELGHINDMEELYGEELEDKQKEYASLGDIGMLNNLSKLNSKALDNNITDASDEFYGDLIELNKFNLTERIIADIYYRFNTAQREKEDVSDYKFIYDELESDDFDLDDFIVDEKVLKLPNEVQRPEGYCYKPHYVIHLRENGRMMQDSNTELMVVNARPIQDNGIKILLTTTLPHKFGSGSKIIIKDKEKNKDYETVVTNVVDRTHFMIQPIIYINWLKLCEELNKDWDECHFKVMRVNTNIPDYAIEATDNVFVWRDVLKPGDSLNGTLNSIPFANGHFYIHQNINFFLRRQDPFGKNGLYAIDNVEINDVYGETYNYITEDEYKQNIDNEC